jgi:hypothetical protein
VIVIQYLTGVRGITLKSKHPIANSSQHCGHNRIHRLNYIQFFPSYTKPSFHTSFPLTHVPSTFPLRSRMTKSASAAGRRVPFRLSMPRQRAGLNVTHLITSPKEQPVNREKFRTQLSRVTTLRPANSQTPIAPKKWPRRTCRRGYRFPPDTVSCLPSRTACHRATHVLHL